MIIKMTHSNSNDFNQANEGFMVSGRIIPKYENDNWTYTEERFTEPISNNMKMIKSTTAILSKKKRLFSTITWVTIVLGRLGFVLTGMAMPLLKTLELLKIGDKTGLISIALIKLHRQ